MKLKLLVFLTFLAIPYGIFAQKSSYVGYKYTGVTYNKKLPNGVKDLGGNLLSNENYAVSQMKKGKTDMLWLTYIAGRNDDGVPKWEVKNVLALPKIKKNQVILRGFNFPCTIGGKENLDLFVLADYSAKTKTYTPKKAWRVNIKKNLFETVAVKKVSCKNVPKDQDFTKIA